ncbi:MAG: GGDEF domain-containing protein [Lachnospiraceae bacterium]|nr:GGDEF domain-containing protein [Lachnospiraceae bacterium]
MSKTEKNIEQEILQNQSVQPELGYVASFFGTVETICRHVITMLPEEQAVTAYQYFERDSNLSEICVVDSLGFFRGILTRNEIFHYFGGLYGYPLHQKRMVHELMKKNPLVVDSGFSIENVSKMAMDRVPSELYQAVVVLKDGLYYGVVTIKDLLSTAVTIQVKRATEANPLTGLPGNISIEEQIKSLIGEEKPFGIMYLDLDNFKAYNDAYGFNSGDRMIKAVACSMEAVCGRTDFLGHIGGDDFVIITRKKDVEKLGLAIIEKFKEYLSELYNTEDWERGYIISKNRNGFTEKFPIASLSIAVVTNREKSYHDMEKLAKKIVKAKKSAKKKSGDAVAVY